MTRRDLCRPCRRTVRTTGWRVRSRPAQGAAAIAFIVCTATLRCRARGDKSFEVLGVVLVLHCHVVVGQEHRVEIETFQRAPVRRSNLEPVPGYADEADEAFVPGGYGSLDCATRAQRYVPFDRVGEVVHLPQVDVVDAHAFQGTLQLLACLPALALAGLGGQEELARASGQARA